MESENGLYVTGVGIYNDPDSGRWIAPSDFRARWDDTSYDFPDSDQVGVMAQKPISGRHGFPVHEACWSLLEATSPQKKIPYDRLCEVLKSLPIPNKTGRLSWDHEYGGITSIDDDYFLPWEDRVCLPAYGITTTVQGANQDPFNVQDIKDILSDTTTNIGNLETQVATQRLSPVHDPFARLPLELCFEISLQLRTADVLNARLASRCFVPVYYSNQFWRSRFKQPSGELSWLFESEQLPGDSA